MQYGRSQALLPSFFLIQKADAGMETKADKKEYIRKLIIDAAKVYRNELAGKVFMYVTGTEYFEVVFQTNRFMHLTGANSRLSAQEFYDKATEAKLTTGQIYFDKEHPYHGAKQKLPCLLLLPMLTNSMVCVVKELKTLTLTYKLGITNLNFTIGLTENIDFEGNKINDWFLPRTLRVKDKSIEKSDSAEFVDFVFVKDASIDKYDAIIFADPNKQIPESVKRYLAETLLDTSGGTGEKD